MRRFGLLLAALLCFACRVAWADDFTLPGLEADSAAYAQTLTSRFPAGGTPQARKAAEQAAAAAIRKPDWAAAAAAWETRIAQGDATAAQWLSLADAQMHRTPPDANHALQAAWQNFSSAEAGAPEVPSLLLMADALKAAEPAGTGNPGAGGRRRTRARQQGDRAEAGRHAPRHRHPGAPRRHRTGSRAPARLHRLHRRPRPPRRFPRRGLGAARSAGAGRGGNARGRSDLRLRPALGRHHADHACAPACRARPASAWSRTPASPSRWPTGARASTSTRGCSCCRAVRRRQSV